MKKKIAFILILPVAYLLISAPASAETLESTLEGVKDQVEDLVIAKDEESVSELGRRIETFKKVFEFSIFEAKDLKIKLLGLDDLSEEESVWRESMVKKLNNFLTYYEEQKVGIEDTTEINLEEIKALASDFKKWRDETYIPVAERVNEFLLIHQEEKAIGVALRRWTRINEDIKKLEKAKIKGVGELRELLDNAGSLISEGESLNEEAGAIFQKNYILTSTSTATSTASSTIPEGSLVINATTSSSQLESATSTEESATSTLPISHPSIKGLVEDSLMKIKGAYQVFIEMSNLVRELLN